METSNPLLKREGAFSTAWAHGESMTLQGVVNKAGILLVLCMASGAFAWTHPELRGPLLIIGMCGGLVPFRVGPLNPATSPVAAPAYAILEGLCLGAISQMIEHRYPGIVLNAMLLTFGVLGAMLAAYTTRTIVVTERLMKGVLAATAAVFLVYLIDMLLGFFGHRGPFIH